MENKKIKNQFELSRLKNMVQDNVIKDKSLSDGLSYVGKTEHIDTKSRIPMSTPEARLDKVAQFRADRAAKRLANEVGGVSKMIGKKALGAIPLLGGLASAATTGDVMAAVPGLDSADDVGMSADAEKMMLAQHDGMVNYDNSPARQARLAMTGELSPEEEQLRFQKLRQLIK